MLRVFVLGVPKTGTVTMTHALRSAGLEAAHSRVYPENPPLAVLLWRAYLEDRDPMHYIPCGVEALADPCMTRPPGWDGQTIWPVAVPGFLRRLREAHPDAWMLLNTRPVDAWLDSVDRWKDLRIRITKAELPFLPAGVGRFDSEMIEWYEGHHERVREVFRADPRFVEFDIGDPEAPAIITRSTGIEIPWWGRMNQNTEVPE